MTQPGSSDADQNLAGTGLANFDGFHGNRLRLRVGRRHLHPVENCGKHLHG